jgi:uncharacterized protein YabN with tetrapyrrole methylase and pyrophosphatase domain
MKEFDELIELVAYLRSERGCLWDREQTHSSLKELLLEEVNEVIEAIESGDSSSLKEELGDLLLHVVFHSQISAEEGEFTIKDVITYLKEKVIRRHPHVFADVVVKDVAEIKENWERIKSVEKTIRSPKPPKDTLEVLVELKESDVYLLDAIIKGYDGLANVRRDYIVHDGKTYFKILVSPDCLADLLRVLNELKEEGII